MRDNIIEPHESHLSVPSDNPPLYKVISVENLLKSIAGNYLHFNRVDRYEDFPGADPNDGQQLPMDIKGNSESKFEKNSDVSAKDIYDRSRSRTYACCFSLENSEHIWEKYANDDENGKVCMVFDFNKLRSMLNLTLKRESINLEYNGKKISKIFVLNYGIVKYVDRDFFCSNGSELKNPIEYIYYKSREFEEEVELRISLSTSGMYKSFMVDGHRSQLLQHSCLPGY